MLRSNTAHLALVTTLLIAATHSAHAAMVSVEQVATDNFLVGDTVTFSIRGDEFYDGTFGGGVNLSWDPTILAIGQVDTDVRLTYPDQTFGALLGTLDNEAGTLTGVGASGEVPDTSFDFAEITFTAIGNGTSSIDIALGTTAAGSLDWVDLNGTEIVPEYIGASATVVPLPAAAWLFASSLVGLGVAGRRSKNKHTNVIST